MRLKHIYISEYKNLKEFSLNLDGGSFIDVFVGKNGSGKSNFFEAIIEIFRHIYEFDKEKVGPDFEYTIKYEIYGKETVIAWKAGKKLSINGNDRMTIGKTPLPDNVLIYYSGHNKTVTGLVDKYEESFGKRIKKADFDESRRFIGIGSEYKALLLAVLLMQKPENKTRLLIQNKLGISTIAQEVRLDLCRPSYAASTHYDIEDPLADRYWKSEGITKTFLDRLSSCISTMTSGPVRSEGYFSNDDRYILYFDIVKIQQEFSDLSGPELFRQFDNLKTLGMLADISISLNLAGGIDASIVHFSDGQFQSVYIYSIIELFKDRNCLILLDEPDAFLHPEWQFDFLKQVFEITDTASKKNHVLMSSHSAITLIPHDKNKIQFFDIKNNRANCYELPKSIAIKKLSSDLIKYSEQEQLLSIINAIQIENKPVLFTEGSTDPIIIKEAWYKLYEEDMPFIPFYAFSCSYINQLITDSRIHSEMNGLPIFALFDFDKAFDQWNGLNGSTIETDPLKGMIKKWVNGETYAIMIPVPNNLNIQKQVIKNLTTGETFGGESYCEIEHLFYGASASQDYYEEELCVGGSRIVFKSDAKKTYFAKSIVPTLDNTYFQVFQPIFDFIKSKC